MPEKEKTQTTTMEDVFLLVDPTKEKHDLLRDIANGITPKQAKEKYDTATSTFGKLKVRLNKALKASGFEEIPSNRGSATGNGKFEALGEGKPEQKVAVSDVTKKAASKKKTKKKAAKKVPQADKTPVAKVTTPHSNGVMMYVINGVQIPIGTNTKIELLPSPKRVKAQNGKIEIDY